MRISTLLAISSVLCVTACRGKVVATAELHGPGTADAHFQSTGAPLVLWADTDGKWHGGSSSHFAAHYEIDVLSGNSKVGHISCDTKDSSESVCGVKVSEGNEHHGDCELKLACELPSIPAGAATLHVTGTTGAGTSDVKKMSGQRPGQVVRFSSSGSAMRPAMALAATTSGLARYTLPGPAPAREVAVLRAHRHLVRRVARAGARLDARAARRVDELGARLARRPRGSPSPRRSGGCPASRTGCRGARPSATRLPCVDRARAGRARTCPCRPSCRRCTSRRTRCRSSRRRRARREAARRCAGRPGVATIGAMRARGRSSKVAQYVGARDRPARCARARRRPSRPRCLTR